MKRLKRLVTKIRESLGFFVYKIALYIMPKENRESMLEATEMGMEIKKKEYTEHVKRLNV